MQLQSERSLEVCIAESKERDSQSDLTSRIIQVITFFLFFSQKQLTNCYSEGDF